MKPETFDKKPTDGSRAPDRKTIVGHVAVACEVVLGTGTLTVAELERLKGGDTITLDRSPADPVDVRINGKVIARGEIVTIDNRFAVRLTEIG
jgi:flagellar motor switch protein FliN/FliY